MSKAKNEKSMKVPTGVYRKLAEVKGESTFGECIEMLLDLASSMESKTPVYAVDGVYFEKIVQARGHALMEAAKNKREASHVKVLIQIGEDTLA